MVYRITEAGREAWVSSLLTYEQATLFQIRWHHAHGNPAVFYEPFVYGDSEIMRSLVKSGYVRVHAVGEEGAPAKPPGIRVSATWDGRGGYRKHEKMIQNPQWEWPSGLKKRRYDSVVAVAVLAAIVVAVAVAFVLLNR
jgi:kynurenine formamidase